MGIFFFTAFLLTWTNDVTALSTSLRSDDVSLQSLILLVQQQAATIQKQEASLQALQNRISILEHSHNSDISRLEHTVSSNSARLGKQVAFSVNFNRQQPLDVGSQGTLKYDTVITNVGDGYVPHTGIFTAPYSGVYAFYASLRSTNDHTWIALGIFKGETQLAEATGDGSDDPWDRGVTFVSTHLNAGEHAYVRQIGGSTFLEAASFTTFSGMLVTAD